MQFAHIGIIVLSAIVSYVIGFLWYSPLLFGKRWTKLRKLDHLDKAGMRAYQRSMGPAYLGSFATTLVQCFMLWVLISLMGIHQYPGALLLSALLWLGFSATTSLSGNLFDKKPFMLWAIDASYTLVGLLVASAILIALG